MEQFNASSDHKVDINVATNRGLLALQGHSDRLIFHFNSLTTFNNTCVT